MKFSIRDIMLVTVIVALAVGWWVERMERYSSRKELQRVQIRLALEEDSNKHLKNVVKVLGDRNAMSEANLKESLKQSDIHRDAMEEAFKKATEAAQAVLNSQAPAANPPKP